MPLNAFRIDNAGPLRHVVCDHVPSVMMIGGPNGVGKSTLLERLHKRLTGQRAPGSQIDIDERVQGLYFPPYRTPIHEPIDVFALHDRPSNSTRHALASHRYQARSSQNWRPSDSRLSMHRRERTRQEADYVPYFEMKRQLAVFQRKRQALLSDIYDDQGEVPQGAIPDVMEPLRKVTRTILPSLEFGGITEEDNKSIVLFNHRNGEQVKFDDLSSGEKDILSLVFPLIEIEMERALGRLNPGEENSTDQADVVMLIDGPEAFLHPELLIRLFNYLVNAVDNSNFSLQVIVATHSEHLLHQSNLDTVFFLRYPEDVNGENQLISVPTDDVQTVREVSAELGLTLLSSGRPILVVEGKSDKEVLQRLFPDLADAVTWCPIGGKRNVRDAVVSRFAGILDDRDYEIWGVVDSDRNLSTAGELDERIFYLPTTCIENLLLVPRAIHKVLQDSCPDEILDDLNVDSIEDVEVMLSDLLQTEEFLHAEIAKRLNEELTFYIRVNDLENLTDSAAIVAKIQEISDRRKVRVAEKIDSIHEDVARAISAGHFEQLNGKSIIAALSSRTGIHAALLARLLASEVQNNEIPEALRDFIRQVLM